ncbi:MAG: tyrosine-type recombinase/integrase [Phycisphaeraceae bacterium]
MLHAVPISSPWITDRASAILAKAMKQSTSPWAFQSPDSRGRQKGKWTYGPLLRRLHLRLREMQANRRSLHVLRHTGATFYANDAGMPVAQLQKFLGHERLAETQRYLHPSAEDLAASLKRVDFSRLAGKEGTAT